MIEVDSSAIARIEYDAIAHKLEVMFTTGRVYEYYRVPRSLYDEFIAAPSKGQFFNAYIRDRFRYREIT
jgi:lysyl-tRNA synthetase class 2